MEEIRKIRKVSVPYEITLLSNHYLLQSFYYNVSVPYEITLLSNTKRCKQRTCSVSVPYEITLLSNPLGHAFCNGMFQYLMKLHYSQTLSESAKEGTQFQYLMKLHYSQTSNKLRHYNAQDNNIRYIYYTI